MQPRTKKQRTVNDDDDDDDDDAHMCPITHETMVDPCILDCGHTFEREVLVRWLHTSSRCPLQCVLSSRRIIPNLKAREIIHASNPDAAKKFEQTPRCLRKSFVVMDQTSLDALDATARISARRCTLYAANGDVRFIVALACTFLHVTEQKKKDIKEAERLFRLAISKGYVYAMLTLAQYYDFRRGGFARNVHEAIRLYSQALAADGGCLEAALCLAKIYHEDEEVPRDMKQALILYRLAATSDEARIGDRALEALLSCFVHGWDGVAPDLREAEHLYLKIGCEQDVTPDLLFAIAYGYEMGRHGLEQDSKRAIFYYEKAVQCIDDNTAYSTDASEPWEEEALAEALVVADDGAQHEQFNQAVRSFVRGDSKEEVDRLLTLAVRRGHVHAHYSLALHRFRNDAELSDFWNHSAGSAKDIAACAQISACVDIKILLRVAADDGHARAQLALARWYQIKAERGVPGYGEDVLAVYRSAAAPEQHLPEAQYRLAALLETGSADCGIPKDPQEALRLYTLASDQGHPAAHARLGKCYAQGELGVGDIATAARFYCRGTASLSAEIETLFSRDAKGGAKALRHYFRILRSQEQCVLGLANCLDVGGSGLVCNAAEAARLRKIATATFRLVGEFAKEFFADG